VKRTILIVSHGSREISANAEFKRLVQKYRMRHPGWKVAYAFLELASPSIPEALEALARETAEILVLPLFLFTAKHVKKHIPKILGAFRKKHSNVKVKLAKPLGSHPKLLMILDERAGKITG
jgi:sirohydrochlorin cobaltochelatase